MGLKQIDNLLKAAGPDRVLVPVKVGDVEEQIWVKRLTYMEANRIFVSILTDREPDPAKIAQARISTISRCLINEDGSQAYPKDAIEAWPADVINAVHSACEKVNAATAAHVEEAEGNSPATPSSDSDTN